MNSNPNRLAALAASLIGFAIFAVLKTPTSEPSSSDLTSNSTFTVDLNTASQAELMLVPGIGEKLATDIIRFREQQGAFSTLDQLTALPGIKSTRLSNLRPYLIVSTDASPEN
jgi:competence protein ComEA